VSNSGQLTFFAESISENTGCISARTPVTITINDAIDAPTGVDGAICVRGRVSLSATAPAGAVVRWYSVAEGGTVLSTANTYLTPTLTETTVYYAESFNATTGCISQVRTPVTATVNANPTPLASVTVGRCGPGTVELSVAATEGITADWYTAATGGSPIAVGTLSFTTPVISATTSYYAAARDLSTGCVSTRALVRAQINPFPAITETVPGSVCGEGTATLRATTATGSTIDWFADEACTELLLNGGTLRIVTVHYSCYLCQYYFLCESKKPHNRLRICTGGSSCFSQRKAGNPGCERWSFMLSWLCIVISGCFTQCYCRLVCNTYYHYKTCDRIYIVPDAGHFSSRTYYAIARMSLQVVPR
jgi:hypothetical protein